MHLKPHISSDYYISERHLSFCFCPVTTWFRWVMWESTFCGLLRSLSFWLTSSSGTWKPTYTWTRKETRKTVRYSPSPFPSDTTHPQVRVQHCNLLSLRSWYRRAAGADGGGDHRLSVWSGQRLLPERVWLLQQDHQCVSHYQVWKHLTLESKLRV